MDKAELYSRSNGLQRQDAKYVLKEYLHQMKWCVAGQDQILDVGCGSGDVTAGLLIPALPESCGQVIGVDLSQDMVKFANELYGNGKLSFRQWDITSMAPPLMLRDSFDHVVSFYCFHWVRNQRQGFSNIYNTLKDGGDMLITFLANNPIFEIYRNMAATTKWYPYMKDVENFITYYQDSKNPSAEVEKLLIDIGFDINICVTKKRKYTYPNFKELRDSVKAVNPFISRMPSILRDEYLDDYIAEVIKMGFAETNNNNNESEKVVAQYSIIIIHASKSNNY